MYCRCGNEKILAHGLCSTCVTHSSGKMRNTSAASVRLSCSATATVVGYAEPRVGASDLSWCIVATFTWTLEMNLMISLCPGCHAKVGRTRVVLSEMPPLLLVLWREQHPEGHQQVMIDFTTKGKLALPVPLFSEER